MKKKGHAFIATRAVALLDRDPETRPLAELLIPTLPLVAMGAWLPDEKFFKAGSGDTQNHVPKMAEYQGEDAKRFVVSQRDTLKQLGPHRKLHALLKDAGRLPRGWWDKAYHGDCPRGEHPANCAMGLATSLTDLLLLGEDAIARRIPDGERRRLHAPERGQTRSVQAGLYFFMLSHFVADAHMPCHTDARPLALYTGKLHEKWEKHIDAQVAAFPDPGEIAGKPPQELLGSAVEAFAMELPDSIPTIGHDIWTEVIGICRASFAASCIVASPDRYPLPIMRSRASRKDEHDLPADAPKPSFDELFEGREALRDEVTAAILHDSVLGVAMTWKKVWQSVT